MPEDELRVDVTRPVGRALRWFAVAWVVLMVAGLVFYLLSDDVGPWQFLTWGALVVGGVCNGWMRFRPQHVVVDRRGIRPPWDRRVPWSRIVSVKNPGPYDRVVKLRLTNGHERRTLLPVELAGRVARIGGVPLE